MFKSANGGAQWSREQRGTDQRFRQRAGDRPAKPARHLRGHRRRRRRRLPREARPERRDALYSTKFGGDADAGNGIALAGPDDVFLVGTTSSRNLATTPNAYSAVSLGGGDVFVVRFNTAAAGSARWRTRPISARRARAGNAIAVNAAGRVFVTGATASAAFPRRTRSTPLCSAAEPTPSSRPSTSRGDKTTLAYSTFQAARAAMPASGSRSMRAARPGGGRRRRANFPISPERGGCVLLQAERRRRRLRRPYRQQRRSRESVGDQRADGVFRVGQTGAYAITVRNAGPAPRPPRRCAWWMCCRRAELRFPRPARVGAARRPGETVTCTNPNALAAGAQTRSPS